MSNSSMTKAGFVAIIGAPNAGKSTLLNHLVGEKLSIVTHKAQTTRMRVLGIITDGDTQIGLIDTPGIFEPKDRLEKAMVRAAWDSLDAVDVILLVVDSADKNAIERAASLIKQLNERECQPILVLNKIDRVDKERLLVLADRFNQSGSLSEIFMISALTGDGVRDLRMELLGRMPVGPWHYPEDQLTDIAERLLAAEITREHLFKNLHDELPYCAAVVPYSWTQQKDGSVVVRQTILVSRTNHRAMVLGKGGGRIKKIGTDAREEMSSQLGVGIHLFLDVKVDEKWKDKTEFYRLFSLCEK